LKSDDWIVERSSEDAMKVAMEKLNLPADQIELYQDEDVLDTWFSSGLFPFASFGWPDVETDEFKGFYPNHVLETGKDILFFWVARMVMFGLLLTDQIPFREVFLHPMVRDGIGRKMSKSLGNVVVPLDIINGATLKK
jgi:valyl-tRNA synthetase